MSHRRTDSVSSIASVASYDSLKPEIANIESSDTSLEALVARAEGIIADFKTNGLHTFTYGPKKDPKTVDLDMVMIAMLASAEECGGREGKRYVASAIVACVTSNEGSSKYPYLHDLGITWLTHLLFIFRTSHGHANQPNATPSAYATPTADETSSILEEGVGKRTKSFRTNVLRRDALQCVITGVYDEEHPHAPPGSTKAELEGTHILRRAVAAFDMDKDSESYKSAVTTFDILRNFARLPDETLKDLEERIDHESNGMALQIDMHRSFDKFKWCLRPTDVPNVYTLKFFGEPPSMMIKLRDQGLQAPVEFKDRSAEVLPPRSGLKRGREYALPDPKFISIHAAVCGILHMSGAGKFFDELLKPHRDNDGEVPPLRCWPEFERLLDTNDLREDIVTTLSASRMISAQH